MLNLLTDGSLRRKPKKATEFLYGVEKTTRRRKKIFIDKSRI